MKKTIPCLLLFLTAIFFHDDLSYAGNDKSSSEMLKELKSFKSRGTNRSIAENSNRAGLRAHKQKNYDKAERLFYGAAKWDISWEKPFFNLACATALQRKYDIALDYLEIAFKKNRWAVLRFAKHDSDLKSLRSKRKYRKLVERSETKISGDKKTFIGQWRPPGKRGEDYSCLDLKKNGTMKAATHCNYGIDCRGKWALSSKNTLTLYGTCSDVGDTRGGGDPSGGTFNTRVTYNKRTGILKFIIKPKHSGTGYFNLKKRKNFDNENSCGCM